MRTVRLLILGNALGQTWPIRAVIFLYFLNNGVDAAGYQMVQWAMFWTLMLVEIPTGWISDRWGRKPTLVTGAALKLMGITCYALGDNIWWFFIGEQILGLAKGFHSGTIQAAMKESLIDDGRGDDYRAVAARSDMIMNLCQLLAVFAGGLIGVWSLRATAIISVIMSVLSLCCFIAVREPAAAAEAKAASKTLSTFFASFRKVWNVPVMWCASVCFAVIVALSQHVYALRQPYALSLGLPKEYFGVLETIALIVMIGGSKLAQKAHPQHDRLWFALMGVLLFGGVIASAVPAGSNILLITLLLSVVCLVRGVATFARPIVEDILQKEDIAADRATVLSVGTFIGFGLVALTGPLIQWSLQSGMSVPITQMWVGIVSGVLYFLTLFTSKWFWK